MAGLPAVLMLLVTALVLLVVSLIAMGVLLIGHEKPFFASADCSVHCERNEQHERRQNQPIMSCEFCLPPSCRAAVAQ
jgi:hypothetical protein